MEFTITTHTAHGAPGDAIESLWPHLQTAVVEDASFAIGNQQIRATCGHDDEPSRAIREERMEPERRSLLEAVCEVCERTAGLQSDWYAVGPAG